MMERLFRGVIPPMISPLKDRDTLDQDGLDRLIEHLIGGGVHGIFLLGTTGEAPSLSYRLRRDLIDQSARSIATRVPFLVGITDTSIVESLHLAQHAADRGAAAVVLSTPYYFPCGQTELIDYVERLVAELPLPLMLYNMPSLTKVWFEPESLQRLAQTSKIVGLKDSSGDLDYFRKAIAVRDAVRPDWSVLMGPEAMTLQSMELGGDGGVAGGANLVPRLFHLFQSGQKEQLPTVQGAIQDLQEIYAIGKYASRFIKGTKCAASLMGICDDFLAEPFHRFRPPERQRVAAILQRLADRHPQWFDRKPVQD
jgi:4-hydroxy-tetrahydrodipicolinate synthase